VKPRVKSSGHFLKDDLFIFLVEFDGFQVLTLGVTGKALKDNKCAAKVKVEEHDSPRHEELISTKSYYHIVDKKSQSKH
jgi:hypothetical protein